MRKIIRFCFATFVLALLISFVGSLFGLALVALFIGYSNTKAISKFKSSHKILTFTNFFFMELGFLTSSIFHLGLLSDLSTSSHIAIGLGLGLLFFVFGISLKNYNLHKRKSKRQRDLFRWYYLFDV